LIWHQFWRAQNLDEINYLDCWYISSV
jgi:hypothetical protein